MDVSRGEGDADNCVFNGVSGGPCLHTLYCESNDLQNIFLGEDIRKQLPKESAEFDDVNIKWKNIMSRMNKDANALRGTHHEGILDTLNDMNLKLEEIQKSLGESLASVRNFPCQTLKISKVSLVIMGS
jgi:hypothetical protein